MTTAPYPLDLDRVYLEIDPIKQGRAWHHSQGLATPTSRWRAYLNQLGLQTLLPWLTEESTGRVRTLLAPPLWPTVWEWVSGTAVEVGQSRLVLLPVEATDADELRVPQEWVDIPSWVGDYYLLLQVNMDDGWVKLAGLTTHETLKNQGDYDWRDRTYSLIASDLISDPNVIWVAEAMAPVAAKRTAVAPLPALPRVQAQSLIQRLSNPALLDPRLTIDFVSWGALLAHGGWRRQMSQQRWGTPNSFDVGQWLQSGIDQLAAQLGWQSVSFQPATVGARGDADGDEQGCLSRSLQIVKDGMEEDYRLQVSALEGDTPNAWRFELRKLNGLVPQGITLRLLTEDLQPFENNQVTAIEPTDVLYIDVALAPAEVIVWAVEPTPNQYEPEMLRF